MTQILQKITKSLTQLDIDLYSGLQLFFILFSLFKKRTLHVEGGGTLRELEGQFASLLYKVFELALIV